jgi:hypothetical protein
MDRRHEALLLLALAPDSGRKWQFAVAVNSLTPGRALWLGMYRGWPPSARRARDVGSGRSIWIFLARGCFAAKSPDSDYWTFLDFLGFSRPNRDFSMRYVDKSVEIFSRRFSVA